MKKEGSWKGIICGECVIGLEFVCKSMAEVDSDNGFGVLLVVDFFIVEKDSPFSCNVSSIEKGDFVWNSILYMFFVITCNISIV